MKKICTLCKQERDAEFDFNWKDKSRGVRQVRCKFCQSQISKDHYENNKQVYGERARRHDAFVIRENRKRLTEYLAVHACIDCGQTDIRVLEFDHVHENKSANITNLLNNAINWETIEAEIAKCEVRCVNCHRIETSERGGWWRSLL